MSLADPLAKARAALLDHLPKDAILARYQAAGGQELISGKFANPESSAALAANAFGLFGERPELLSLPSGCLGGHEAQGVQLEAQMRFPWSGGFHPWLDVGVQTAERLIGIESKRYEPFRDHKTATFSAAYARPVWGQAMGPYEAMRDDLSAGRRFAFLDAAQLVKHAFGLRTQGQRTGRQAVLCYLYAEPRAFPDGRPIPASAILAHRDGLRPLPRRSRPPSPTWRSAVCPMPSCCSIGPVSPPSPTMPPPWPRDSIWGAHDPVASHRP